MSEICKRGYKCMCFQCGEKDCEKYEPETPKWVEALINDEAFMRAMKELGESTANVVERSEK